MKLNNFLIVLITININLLNKVLTYEIPEPTFILLSPKGFRVSIPDEPGIKIFAFQGAINRNLLQLEPGDFSKVITSPINQQWIYDNQYLEILPNDILNYWFHIQYNNETFQKNNGIYPIGKAIKYNDYLNSLITSTTTEIPINKNYEIPIPKIERIYPKGFRLSIPDESGIKVVAFHGKLNNKIDNYENGDFNQVITRPINNKWIYENQEINIQLNDILNYWLHVQYGHTAFTLPVNSYEFNNNNILISPSLFGITTNTTNIPILSNNNNDNNFINIKDITNSIEDNHCEESITIVTNNLNKICKGQLIFEDTFDKYDRKKWEKEIKFSGIDNEFVFYDNQLENLNIQNGKLNIIPSLTVDSEYRKLRKPLNLGRRCTDDIWNSCQRNYQIPPIISSKIRSKKSFSFRYGQIDVRAKLPKGDWIFPQILLEPLNNKYGKGYSSGQIRIAFIRGNDFLESKEGEQIDGHKLYGGVVIDHKQNLQDIWLKSTEIYPEHFGLDFHNYSLIWTNDYIRLEVDGISYGNKIRGDFINSAHGNQLKYSKAWINGTKMAPFDQEFYISFGVGVGGKLNFPDGIENGPKNYRVPWLNSHPRSEVIFWDNRNEWKKTWTKNNSKLIIDYVRVYAL